MIDLNIILSRIMLGVVYLVSSILFSVYFRHYNIQWIAISIAVYFLGTRAVIHFVLAIEKRACLLNGILSRTIQYLFGSFLILLLGLGVFMLERHIPLYYLCVTLMLVSIFRDSKKYSGGPKNEA